MNNVCGWIALAGESPQRPKLTGSQKTDWLIIGGGITGLSAAHSLAQMFPQQRIVLLDRQRVAQGASARNSGFVVSHELPGLDELIGQPGHDAYQLASRIGVAAGKEVRQRIAELDIKCEFSEAGYHFAVHQPQRLDHSEQCVATLNAAGASASSLEGKALQQRLGSRFYQRAIHCAGGNGLLQPAKYVKGLLDRLPAQVEVYENSSVDDLQPIAGKGWRARTAEGEVEAAQVLVCVGAFLPRVGLHRSGTFALELSASITRPLTGEPWQTLFDDQGWGVLSTLPGGATVRLLPGRRLLIRNTVEYRQRDLNGSDLAARQHQHLLGLQKRFPGITATDLQHTWTGHLSATRSGEPYFSRIAERLHGVAGCNGSGVARGTLWGRLLAEMAAGSDSPVLRDVLAQARPGYLPPRPLFDIGATLRMGWEVRRARHER
ncbi:FAD-dependent oxidoreductase [Pseudomonas frederiksbergensis]|uniref:FAD-dependent oxidoreductase n=1 Tax=Pseudomonas frederiksbergensis TaxID=104087 RepID=A0A1J0ES36_9PSED|nr:FAD-binding oxidoreductase [Pseudomonas frederiksbergensis]APC18913.1 FAD-dependent oxidoreductase [Pseudomonas frederiksbergensis]